MRNRAVQNKISTYLPSSIAIATAEWAETVPVLVLPIPIAVLIKALGGAGGSHFVATVGARALELVAVALPVDGLEASETRHLGNWLALGANVFFAPCLGRAEGLDDRTVINDGLVIVRHGSAVAVGEVNAIVPTEGAET